MRALKQLSVFAFICFGLAASAQTTTKTLVRSVPVLVGDTLFIETAGAAFATVYADVKSGSIETTVTIMHPRALKLADALVQSGRYRADIGVNTITVGALKPAYSGGVDIADTLALKLTVPVGVVVIVRN